MRVFFVIVLLAGLFVSCKNSNDQYFVISGKIKHATSPMLYLEETPIGGMQRVIVDSARIGKDSSYTLRARATEESMFNIKTGMNIYPIVYLINDVDKVKVDIDLSNPENLYKLEGSPASAVMKKFVDEKGLEVRDIYQSSLRLDSLAAANTPDSTMVPLVSAYNGRTAALKKDVEQAIAESKNPGLTIFYVNYYQTLANNAQVLRLEPFSNDEVAGIIDNAAARFPQHNGVASIKRTFDLEKSKSLVGKPAPDFTLPDVNGRDVRLSSFRGKYVLVDFWASWCTPCRMENPNVVKAYNEFKDKNFTILGVSLDRPGQKDKWVKAINDDHLSWTHVSDLQFWNSQVVPLYGFDGIPYNVLIDPQGKIIAENLRGPLLESRLNELLN